MRHRALLLTLTLLALVPGIARAQDFGIVESSETIDKGNFKIRANPMLIFGKNGSDNQLGVAVVLGYGVTHRFDVEGGVAVYDGVTFFGGNGEFWIVKRKPFDFSIAVGLHGRTGSKTVDATGVDLTFLPGKHVTERLDLYAGLDLAFESVSAQSGGGSFKTAHIVPGMEYSLNHNLDFVAELGIALNDAAHHYVSAGFAYYFR